MTGKEDKIRSLKSRIQEKRFQIEKYQQNAKKRIFYFSIILLIITLFYLEDSYKYFGTLENFVMISLSVLFSFAILYTILVVLLVRRRKKEIKRINARMYRLMKLERK